MGLPIVLNTPKYELELPISKKTVSYRPYLVKEEKILMMAIESGDQKMILKAVQDIIDACTFNEIKAKDLPTAELEFIFLKLRSKSVGETSNVGIKCSSCDKTNEMSINIESIAIDTSKSHDGKVMITPTVGLIMKYPTANEIMKNINQNDDGIKNTFAIITSCIDTIFDAENVYKASELPKKDIEDFIDSLNAKQFELVKEFFDSIPRLYKNIDYTCEHCGAENHVKLEGLQNFFG